MVKETVAFERQFCEAAIKEADLMF